MKRINPFVAAERGIERHAPVYGVVPLHTNGKIMKEHGQYPHMFPND